MQDDKQKAIKNANLYLNEFNITPESRLFSIYAVFSWILAENTVLIIIAGLKNHDSLSIKNKSSGKKFTY